MEKKKRKPPCYLRMHRRRWGLSTKQLAPLLGLRSAPHLSRIENGQRPPTVRLALACQVVFGVAPAEMFPNVFVPVEDRTMRNIAHLHLALEHSTSLAGIRKRELCEEAVKRAKPEQA